MTEYADESEIQKGLGERLFESEKLSSEERNELEFLRFFYEQVDNAMGPGSDDVYYLIQQDWINQGKSLPEGYRSDD